MSGAGSATSTQTSEDGKLSLPPEIKTKVDLHNYLQTTVINGKKMVDSDPEFTKIFNANAENLPLR